MYERRDTDQIVHPRSLTRAFAASTFIEGTDLKAKIKLLDNNFTIQSDECDKCQNRIHRLKYHTFL